MSVVPAPRNTTTRDRHRAVIARGKPDCALCLAPIDYTLKYPDPRSFVVDHIVPLGKSPTPERIAELDVLTNKQPAHADCNWAKAAKVAEEPANAPRTFVTARVW